MSCPEIADARNTAGVFFANPFFRKSYFDQEILRMDHDSMIYHAEKRGIEQVVIGLLKNHAPLDLIQASSQLSAEQIRALAAKLGLTV